MVSKNELRAQLKVVELEEKLLAAKGSESGPSRELKNELREARRVHREMREARAATDGTARPGTVAAQVTGVNGGGQ